MNDLRIRPAVAAAILVCRCGCRLDRVTPAYVPVEVRDQFRVTRCGEHGGLTLRQVLDLGVRG